jgi:hypothetical protein
MKKPAKFHDMTPGAVVAAEFTCGEAARACGVSRSTVLRWSRDKPEGTGGIVPSVYHLPLLNLASELGRSLTANDLVYGRKTNRGA